MELAEEADCEAVGGLLIEICAAIGGLLMELNFHIYSAQEISLV